MDNTRPRYRVLVNDEDQHSLWPVHRDRPAGWREVGVTGPRDECLAYVREAWTDLRPARLRGPSGREGR
jgi:MbtH protein